jgi:NADH-quinone oxidoreductase subunit N
VASVVAAFYYLRIIKLMWFDAAPEGTAATDPAPVESQWIGWACAAFSFPLVIVGLSWLEPLTRIAATGFGAK